MTEEDTNKYIEGETQQDSLAPKCSEEYLKMEEAIMVLTEEVEDLNYALIVTRHEGPHHEFPSGGYIYKTKETQWTSTAPTERSTMIGSDESSEIISTITAASNQ